MAYPHGIDAMPTFTNGVSPTDPTPSAVLDAAEMTLIAGAITRIQQTLGIDPASGSLSVADRLASIEQVLQGKASASDAVTEAELATALETMVDAATLTAALAPLAPIESPDLTGAPTAPTAASGTATTQLATTAFVAQALGDIDGGTP